MPLNVSTGEPFTAVNTLLLQVVADHHAFAARWWGTASDWSKLGGSVLTHAEPTILFDDQACEFAVFNIQQVAGITIDRFRPTRLAIIDADHADYSAVETAIKATGADIRVGVGDERYLETQTMYICPDPWGDWAKSPKGRLHLDSFRSMGVQPRIAHLLPSARVDSLGRGAN